MEVLYPRCAALDVHKDMLVAAIRLAEGSAVQHEVRTFATTTRRPARPIRLARRARLHPRRHGSHRRLLAPGLAGARRRHPHLDPGQRRARQERARRKTDVADAVWLCDLLAHGLIRASFVPEAQTKAMRDLLRTASSWSASRPATSSASRRRSRKPISSSPRCSPTSWACPAAQSSTRWSRASAIRPGCRPWSAHGEGRAEAIRAALTGRIDDHHRFLLGVHLRQYDGLKAAIAEVDAQVERDLGPFREAVEFAGDHPRRQ